MQNLRQGDSQEDPWDSDAEKPLEDLAERESCTPRSQPLLSEAAPLPILTHPPTMASCPRQLWV